MLQILDNLKRQVKKTSLDDIDIPSFIAKDTLMDPCNYFQYIIPELGNPKVKDFTFALLDKLYR